MDSARQPEFIRFSFPEPIASISAPIYTAVCSHCRIVGGRNWPGSCVIWDALVAQKDALVADAKALVASLEAEISAKQTLVDQQKTILKDMDNERLDALAEAERCDELEENNEQLQKMIDICQEDLR